MEKKTELKKKTESILNTIEFNQCSIAWKLLTILINIGSIEAKPKAYIMIHLA